MSLPTKADYEKFFKETDTDGSGYLSKDELYAMLKKKGMSKSKSESMFKSSDASGDGKVSLHEFLTAMGVMTPEDNKEMAMRTTFNSFDTNGSGKIDKHELKKCFEEMKKYFSEDEMARMIANADIDGDGEMDYEEFIKENFGQ